MGARGHYDRRVRPHSAPEKEPLDRERRHDHFRWRIKALCERGACGRGRERRHTIRRSLTLGLWWD